jgi:hypothetical protein
MHRSRSHVRALRTGAALALIAAAPSAVAIADTPPTGQGIRAVAAGHFPCSGPGAAHAPCYFSTPSGNIHCQWIPARNAVECELLSTHLAYRLRPTGRTQRIRIHLWRRGETLPAGPNQLVFPEALSCHAGTSRMTCNQDFGPGMFVLAPHGSHAA